jgi:hypothetical protein
MDYRGLVKRLQVPDGYIVPRELSYHDIRAHERKAGPPARSLPTTTSSTWSGTSANSGTAARSPTRSTTPAGSTSDAATCTRSEDARR